MLWNVLGKIWERLGTFGNVWEKIGKKLGRIWETSTSLPSFAGYYLIFVRQPNSHRTVSFRHH